MAPIHLSSNNLSNYGFYLGIDNLPALASFSDNDAHKYTYLNDQGEIYILKLNAGILVWELLGTRKIDPEKSSPKSSPKKISETPSQKRKKPAVQKFKFNKRRNSIKVETQPEDILSETQIDEEEIKEVKPNRKRARESNQPNEKKIPSLEDMFETSTVEESLVFPSVKSEKLEPEHEKVAQESVERASEHLIHDPQFKYSLFASMFPSSITYQDRIKQQQRLIEEAKKEQEEQRLLQIAHENIIRKEADERFKQMNEHVKQRIEEDKNLRFQEEQILQAEENDKLIKLRELQQLKDKQEAELARRAKEEQRLNESAAKRRQQEEAERQQLEAEKLRLINQKIDVDKLAEMNQIRAALAKQQEVEIEKKKLEILKQVENMKTFVYKSDLEKLGKYCSELGKINEQDFESEPYQPFFVEIGKYINHLINKYSIDQSTLKPGSTSKIIDYNCKSLLNQITVQKNTDRDARLEAARLAEAEKLVEDKMVESERLAEAERLSEEARLAEAKRLTQIKVSENIVEAAPPIIAPTTPIIPPTEYTGESELSQVPNAVTELDLARDLSSTVAECLNKPIGSRSSFQNKQIKDVFGKDFMYPVIVTGGSAINLHLERANIPQTQWIKTLDFDLKMVVPYEFYDDPQYRLVAGINDDDHIQMMNDIANFTRNKFTRVIFQCIEGKILNNNKYKNVRVVATIKVKGVTTPVAFKKTEDQYVIGSNMIPIEIVIDPESNKIYGVGPAKNISIKVYYQDANGIEQDFTLVDIGVFYQFPDNYPVPLPSTFQDTLYLLFKKYHAINQPVTPIPWVTNMSSTSELGGGTKFENLQRSLVNNFLMTLIMKDFEYKEKDPDRKLLYINAGTVKYPQRYRMLLDYLVKNQPKSQDLVNNILRAMSDITNLYQQTVEVNYRCRYVPSSDMYSSRKFMNQGPGGCQLADYDQQMAPFDNNFDSLMKMIIQLPKDLVSRAPNDYQPIAATESVVNMSVQNLPPPPPLPQPMPTLTSPVKYNAIGNFI